MALFKSQRKELSLKPNRPLQSPSNLKARHSRNLSEGYPEAAFDNPQLSINALSTEGKFSENKRTWILFIPCTYNGSVGYS